MQPLIMLRYCIKRKHTELMYPYINTHIFHESKIVSQIFNTLNAEMSVDIYAPI